MGSASGMAVCLTRATTTLTMGSSTMATGWEGTPSFTATHRSTLARRGHVMILMRLDCVIQLLGIHQSVMTVVKLVARKGKFLIARRGHAMILMRLDCVIQLLGIHQSVMTV